MKNITKFIIMGVSAGVVAAVAYRTVKKHHEEKYITPDKYKTSEEDVTSKDTQEKQSLKDRIAEAATDKVLDILAWAGNHEKEMKGLAMTLTVAGGVIDLALGLKKVFKRSKLFKDIDDIKQCVWATGYDAGWKASSNDVFEKLNAAVEAGETFKFYDKINDKKIVTGEWIVKNAREAMA